MTDRLKVGFYGLSHLGINSSICLATCDVTVVGVDTDAAVIASLNREELPFFEPQLAETLNSVKSRIAFSQELSALGECDVVYYSRDIPTSEENISDLSRIAAELPLLLPHLKKGSVLVVLSQVTPGFCREFSENNVELLKERGIQLCYQVETLIFGRAVERALKPERYIIGLTSSNDRIPANFSRVLQLGGCPIFQMSYESAELAKISINLFLVASVSTSNMIAAVCEEIGASWTHIAEVLKLDSRIGPRAYLAPGLGIAGGNLERDLETLKRLSSKFGTKSELLRGFDSQLSYAASWPLRKLSDLIYKHGMNPAETTIGILGLSYKQDTNSIKNSPSIATIRGIRSLNIVAFDPVVKNLPSDLENVRLANTINECIQAADLVMFLTPWTQFREFDRLALLENKIVIDPFGVVRLSGANSQFKDYVSMGESGV